MSNPDLQVLLQLNQLRRDVAGHDFVWQVLALLLCLGLAYFLAHRWLRWRREQAEPARRLGQIGARLAFPLLASGLVGLVCILLKPFMAVSLLGLAWPLLAALALVRAVISTLRHSFSDARWLSQGERLISSLVWLWLVLYLTDLAPHVIEMFERVEFRVGKREFNLWMILSALTTIFFTVVTALWLSSMVENRLMGAEKLDGNLRLIGVRVVKAVLTVIALLLSLSLFGVDITALSVFTGALGVGLGIGLQKIAANYVAGFILLLERAIRIGNLVQVGADAGTISEITTRYTVIRSGNGIEAIVPNETMISSTVLNQTLTDRRQRLVTSVGVGYGSDVEAALQTLIDCALAQPRVLASPAPAAFLTQFADSSINLELGFWIADPENGKANILSAVNLEIWRRFKAQGIEIPFPQREIRVLSGG